MRLPDDTKILIIEDDPGHARLIEIFLVEAGFSNERIVLGRGDEAADLLFEEGKFKGHPRPRPMVVFLDLNLPGLHGYSLLERMREKGVAEEMPVIVITSSADPDERNRAITKGADAFIAKPPSAQAIRDTFARLGLLAN